MPKRALGIPWLMPIRQDYILHRLSVLLMTTNITLNQQIHYKNIIQ